MPAVRKFPIKAVFIILIVAIGAGLTLFAAIKAGNTGTSEDADSHGAFVNNKDVLSATKAADTGQKSTAIPEQTDELKGGMNEKMALSMAQKFCNDMSRSWLELERADMSDYLVDNADTHLALRWIDFDIADRLQNKWKRLVSVDSVEVSGREFDKISEDQVVYEAYAEIDYTRQDPEVTGIGINLTLRLEKIEGSWKITGADTIAASVYQEWKKGGYITIEEMDKAFWDTCEKKGLIDQAKKLIKD